jgi:hypothetical protein
MSVHHVDENHQLESRTPELLYQIQLGQMERKFAAISCSCKASQFEQKGKGTCQIIVPNQPKTRQPRIRDIILPRVIIYLEHHQLSTFWVDEECIDVQDKEVAKKSNGYDKLSQQLPYWFTFHAHWGRKASEPSKAITQLYLSCSPNRYIS